MRSVLMAIAVVSGVLAAILFVGAYSIDISRGTDTVNLGEMHRQGMAALLGVGASICAIVALAGAAIVREFRN